MTIAIEQGEASPRTRLQEGLRALQPRIVWCHHFDLGHGVETVTIDHKMYYEKALGLKKIGRQIIESVPFITSKRDIGELSVLDLACGEGAHAVAAAQAGARRVLGIEGRKLYVDRCQFVKECLSLDTAEFRQGDVRTVDVAEVGQFDLVLFLGILHHLAAEDFDPMLRRLYDLTADTCVIYTHTSETGCEVKFGDRLSEEIETATNRRGRLYIEHPEGISDAQKERRVRNSLNNDFGFWARERSLVDGLRDAGFSYVARQIHPNPFGDPAGAFRVLYVCRR
ncbi:class I SAM-dependent methyltransferase [Phenylobacterium sp.]|uniref:class I SAM-dependent methyltransferase n=1 Tax=Phenylobacterium sp. TaxID=1871053 RepID=UPI002FC67C45